MENGRKKCESDVVCVQGSIMIFVGLLSVIFLKKRLEWFRWTGMAVVVCGIAMVGEENLVPCDLNQFLLLYLTYLNGVQI